MTQRVLIVGGGLAGASIAWHLSARSSVQVLEAGNRIGSESSRQNAGMLRRLGEDPYERRLAERSHRFLQSPPEDWTGLCPAKKTGALMLLSQDPHHLEDGVSHLRALDVSIEAPRELSQFRSLLGRQSFCGAYYLPDEMACFPKDLLEGFRRGIHRKGQTLRLNTAVRRLLEHNGRVVGVETDEGPRYADKVVLAAGAWSSDLAGTLGLKRPITPLRRSLFFTGSHPLYRADFPWIWIDDIGIYARPYQGGFLLSPCDERVDWPSSPGDSWGTPADWQTALLQEKLQRYFPGLASTPLQKSWTGLRCFAPDRRPVLGEDPEAPGLWWAAGLGGFGLSGSIGVGEALASWLEDQQCGWIDPRPVNPGRTVSTKWLMRPDGHIHRGQLIHASRPETHTKKSGINSTPGSTE